MTYFILMLALFAIAAVFSWKRVGKSVRRIHYLERDLERLSEAVSQMAEVQMKAQQKYASRFDDMEERIMELSVPTHDATMPLERRHQVLALARQGVALDEIVKRLKAPVGEAELILNLHRYAGGDSGRTVQAPEQVRQYA